MLERVRDTHRYNTRSAENNIAITARDQGSISYRIPKEWATLTEEEKDVRSFAAFKRRSKKSFIDKYEGFQCGTASCGICGALGQ